MIRGHRQHMWITNLVRPITALYSGPLGLRAYFTIGRRSTHAAMHMAWSHEAQYASQSKPLVAGERGDQGEDVRRLSPRPDMLLAH